MGVNPHEPRSAHAHDVLQKRKDRHGHKKGHEDLSAVGDKFETCGEPDRCKEPEHENGLQRTVKGNAHDALILQARKDRRTEHAADHGARDTEARQNRDAPLDPDA